MWWLQVDEKDFLGPISEACCTVWVFNVCGPPVPHCSLWNLCDLDGQLENHMEIHLARVLTSYALVSPAAWRMLSILELENYCDDGPGYHVCSSDWAWILWVYEWRIDAKRSHHWERQQYHSSPAPQNNSLVSLQPVTILTFPCLAILASNPSRCIQKM